MKKLFYTLLLGISFLGSAQVTNSTSTNTTNTKELSKKIVGNSKPNTLIASDIEVYISIAKGLYTTHEIYDLFRGDNPKIKLISVSYGVPSKVEIKAIDGVFPNLVDQYETIRYQVKIVGPEKPTYIVACIDEQELLQKNAQIQIHHKDEACSGVLSKNNFLGIEPTYTGIYKKMDSKEKGCDYIRFIDLDKTIQFRISPIPHER